MDAVLKRDWIDALRSGEHKQGYGRLKRNGKYCCLGVLCKVMGLPEITRSDGDGIGFEYKGQTAVAALTGPLAEDLKLLAVERKLISLNDNTKAPFSDIADWIEDEVKGEA